MALEEKLFDAYLRSDLVNPPRVQFFFGLQPIQVVAVQWANRSHL